MRIGRGAATVIGDEASDSVFSMQSLPADAGGKAGGRERPVSQETYPPEPPHERARARHDMWFL